MIFAITQAVHTTGVNWESIAVITGIVTVVFTVFTWITLRRDQKSEARSNAVKNEITTAVNNLSDVLQARLETKEVVGKISERLARVEGVLDKIASTTRP
jgi:sensor domain CHASE-containing protein